MKASKEMKYENRNVDLSKLRADIVGYLQTDGFKVQQPKQSESRMLIQAQKGGFLKELISAERALNIMIDGTPNDITIRIGIGKWIQNIAVTAVETLLITELFLPLDVAEMVWNLNVENKVAKRIDEMVRSQSATTVRAAQT
jgi:hypothetical protein